MVTYQTISISKILQRTPSLASSEEIFSARFQLENFAPNHHYQLIKSSKILNLLLALLMNRTRPLGDNYQLEIVLGFLHLILVNLQLENIVVITSRCWDFYYLTSSINEIV